MKIKKDMLSKRIQSGMLLCYRTNELIIIVDHVVNSYHHLISYYVSIYNNAACNIFGQKVIYKIGGIYYPHRIPDLSPFLSLWII